MTEQERFDDCIGREAVMEILNKHLAKRPLDSDRWVIRDIMSDIKTLPSVTTKDPEPRIMTLQEINATSDVVYIEIKGDGCQPALHDRVSCSMYYFSVIGSFDPVITLECNYGKSWRCWTMHPDKNQRKAVPWR